MTTDMAVNLIEAEIEQAWRRYDSALVSAHDKGWTPERAEYVNEKQDELVQAILRYHPDVVRLVERLGAWEQWADDGCPAGLRPAALVPFKEVQDAVREG